MHLSYKRDELLALLREAKDRQEQKSSAAWTRWEEESREKFEELVLEARSTGSRPGMPWAAFPSTTLPFETIISAVEASTDEQVQLSPSEFAMYVLGESDSRVPFDLF